MNTDLRCAGVYLRERFAGVLAETEAGYRFTYDPEYLNDASAPAASLTLPRQDKPFFSKTLFVAKFVAAMTHSKNIANFIIRLIAINMLTEKVRLKLSIQEPKYDDI